MTKTGIMFNNSLGILETVKGQSLMQFTGLLDKNGKEIYESDILSFFGGSQEAEVKWEDCGGWSVVIKTAGGNAPFEVCCLANHLVVCEVVGNIYENPLT